MKYCSQCGAQMADEAAFCPQCGAAAGASQQQSQPQYQQPQQTQYQQPQQTQYQQPQQTQYQQPQQTQYPYQQPQYQQPQKESGMKTAAKVFMIIGTVAMGVAGYLIPLAWCIPMTVSYFKKVKTGQPISTGFKVCSLLFVSLVGGILMLCDNEN